jgi:AraC family transcriptional regulator
MTPGSAMLVNPGQCYTCGHEHGTGDRCVAFWYTREYFERVAADTGARQTRFRTASVPAIAQLSSLVSQTAARILTPADDAWEELSLRVAALTLALGGVGLTRTTTLPAQALRRVTDAVRSIESRASGVLTLSDLAREARLSPYHFLRSFERLTGTTPHQYLRRARLRDAAVRLIASPDKVLDIALDCGFGDVSNFNRAFRAEFGASPREYRRRTRMLPARRV